MSSLAPAIAPGAAEWNPFAAPAEILYEEVVSDAEKNKAAEDIRREYLSCERSLIAIAWLFYLAAVALIATGLMTIGLSAYAYFSKPAFDLVAVRFIILVGFLLFLFGSLTLSTGRGIEKLDRSARPYSIVLSTLFILGGTPLGAIIWGAALWGLCGKKICYVFSQDYQRIRNATPYIRSDKPWLMISLVVLVAAFVALIVVATLATCVIGS